MHRNHGRFLQFMDETTQALKARMPPGLRLFTMSLKGRFVCATFVAKGLKTAQKNLNLRINKYNKILSLLSEIVFIVRIKREFLYLN